MADVEFVKMLVNDQRVFVSAKFVTVDGGADTALKMACAKNRKDVVKYLINHPRMQDQIGDLLENVPDKYSAAIKRILARRGRGRRACGQCGGPAKLKCTHCMITYYCNKACQKAHWPSHKQGIYANVLSRLGSP